MKKLLKNISLTMALLFVITLFKPFSILAADTLTPSLTMNNDGKYTVSSIKDLNSLRNDIDKGIDYSGKNIILTEDINISESEPLNSFTSKNFFNGNFNGGFHTISGYTDEKSGLFSFIGKDGAVANVRIDANVVIKDNSLVISDDPHMSAYGLISNTSGGTITRCSTTGTITNTNTAYIAGITGYSILKTENIPGEITNCYSNVIFNNKAEGSAPPQRAGICYEAGNIIEHCYFYGKFIGNEVDENFTLPIKGRGGTAKTCAYDKDLLGFFRPGSSGGKKYTTEKMKTKDTYIALSFDFDKCWKIDTKVNDGYPYLNPENKDKVAETIPLDIKVTVEDKTYDASLNSEENLKAKVTDVQVANVAPETEALIEKYDVKVDYEVKNAEFHSIMGNVPVTVNFDKLEVNYTPNKEYKFVINKVLPTYGNFIDNGADGPTDEEKAKQVEQAKQAQDILYKKFKIGQGDVPPLKWFGNKATEKDGTIELVTDVWGVFSSARSGYKGVRPGYYDDWFKSIQEGLKKMKDEGITPLDVKMTEWDKLVLAITSIGYDPRDIEAYDLIDIISNQKYLSKSTPTFSKQYAILALNSYKYSIPKEGQRIDIEDSIHQWAEGAKNGCIVSPNRAADMSVMGYQPIAAYYDPNAKEGDEYYDVKVAMEEVFKQYSRAQTYEGFFWGGYPDDNAWNNAQVYMTLGMTKTDLFDRKYIKNGNSIFNGALSYYDFENETTTFDETTYEPAQICRGLDSLVRGYEKRNSIFDCTDVKDSTVPVNNAIDALPDSITPAHKEQVEKAWSLYNELSAPKKASIKESKIAKLDAARKAIDTPTVEDKTLEITNLTEQKEFKLGNDAKITVQATNKSDENKNAALIVGVYDNNGVLISYGAAEQNIDASKNVKLDVTLKLPKQGEFKVKGFIWDSLEGMQSLSDPIEISVVK